MKKKIHLNTERLLVIIAAAIALIIALVTLVSLAAGKRPGTGYRKKDPSGISVTGGSESISEFREFGTLRIRTLPDSEKPDNANGSLLIVTPWFSYEDRGPDFYEELVAKKKLFASFFMEYFSSHTKADLLLTGEKSVKQLLLDRMNGELILGKLSALYFDDYMFMD